MTPTIEVEIRSFVSDAEFNVLLARFKEEGEHLGVDTQETWYFDGPHDLRVQRNDSYAKVWMKKGKMHDESREEIEVRFERGDFPKLSSLFAALGHDVAIKWFRTRHAFDWKGVRVALDDTRGYGRILELEKLADETGKAAALADLKEKMSALDIALTPREEFERRFEHYKEHWKELTTVNV